MKKILLLLILAILSIEVSVAQTLLPGKVTKGLIIRKDKFNNSVIYKSRSTGFTVESHKDKCVIKWEYTYMSKVENDLDEISFSVDGKIFSVNYDDSNIKKYTQKKEKVSFNTASEMEKHYYTQLDINMKDNIALLEKIASSSNVPMVRFLGTIDITKNYSKKDKKEIMKILLIYNMINKPVK